MSLEKYNYDNKELILNAISEQDFNDSKNVKFYEKEVMGIIANETYADFLALTPWRKITDISKIILSSLEKIEPHQEGELEKSDSFFYDTSKEIESWYRDVTFKLNRIDSSSTLRNDLKNSRHLMSTVQDPINLKRICNVIVSCDNLGALPKDNNNQSFLQFPGSFNPFPHNGHIEIALIAKAFMINKDGLILITTFDKNMHRADDSRVDFSAKIDILQRSFAFVQNAIVYGIKGDTGRQYQQMKLLTSFDNNNSIHYICGDDAFIKKVNQAKKGDCTVLEYFNNRTTFYVSKRNGCPNNLLSDSCLYAKENGTNVILLPNQKLNLSGTKIREKIDHNDLDESYYPNNYVKEYINNYLSSE